MKSWKCDQVNRYTKFIILTTTYEVKRIGTNYIIWHIVFVNTENTENTLDQTQDFRKAS